MSFKVMMLRLFLLILLGQVLSEAWGADLVREATADHLDEVVALIASRPTHAEASAGAATAQPDAADDDVCRDCRGAGSTYWIRQLIANGFRIHDKDVCYPAFPRFALNVYNWGDRTFNSYDTTYVVGTGKNWKLQGKAHSWMETSMMTFPKGLGINMHSDVYSDAGFSLSFMAVSLGYMWNMNKLITGRPTSRRTFNLDFTCSRFSINYQSVTSSGGMIITRFGDYADGHHIHYRFGNTSNVSKTFDAYWFFNHYHYSQGAAYSYSKYQLKNAGTMLVGFDYASQDTFMDFSQLPDDMLEYLPLDTPFYHSKYRSYNLLGGYTHNWVLSPRRWLLNSLVMVAVGYRKLATHADNVDISNQIANNFRLNLAAVYNHRALFASLTARMHGFINYNANDMTHFNAIFSLTGTVGMRF